MAPGPAAAGAPGAGEDEDVPDLPRRQLNSLGYYPPARALIVRGTTRYHPAATIKLKTDEGHGGRSGQPARRADRHRPRRRRNNAAPAKPKDPVAVKPTTPRGQGPGGRTPSRWGRAPSRPSSTRSSTPPILKPKLSGDPKRRWNEAIDWTVTDPGLIVASAEFLMDMDEYAAAAEVLKGSLRKGLATDAWAHESLALALQMSQASPAEIERAALSAIDLDPTDAKAYLKAAKVAAELKNHDQAIAFSKRAAEFAPDQPVAYANALAYAEHATDVKTDAVVWAAHNLLSRDWNVGDGINYHADQGPAGEAHQEVRGRRQERRRPQEGARRADHPRPRDRVNWQGTADLDLIVAEPGGSICSHDPEADHRRRRPQVRRPRTGQRPLRGTTPPRWPSRAPTRSP